MQDFDELFLPEQSFTYRSGSVTLPAMTVYDTRWQNFRALIGPDHGAITDAAKLLGKSQGQVSHFGGARPIKNIGHKLARQIEEAYRKPEGWLDREQLSEGEEKRSDPLGKTITSALVSASQPVTLDPHILVEAEKWVLFEEGVNRKSYPLLPRAERLSAIYAMILADGGSLSPENSKRLIDAADARLNQGEGNDRGRQASGGASSGKG